MTTIIHLLWSASYILITIIIYTLSIIYLRGKNKKFKPNLNNKMVMLFLVYIYNKNLQAISKLLLIDDYNRIEYERESNYPSINLIHRNIDRVYKPKVVPIKVKFKSLYKMHKLISNNLKYSNILDSYRPVNTKVIFSILNIIVNKTYKNVNKFTLIILVLYRNSISSKPLSIKSYIRSVPQSYFSYVYACNPTKILSSIQKVILNNKGKPISFNIKIRAIKPYFNIPYLIRIKKNYLYLLVLNKYLSLNLNFNPMYISSLKKKYNISFSASNIVKYMSDYSVNKSIILFLRRDKVFNKSRYSRNRQTYRTGAYWCLYLNIIAVLAFYFWFYKFTINFGYLWWLLYTFFLSFFIPRAIKYKFYNPTNIIIELISGIRWLFILLLILLDPVKKNIIIVLSKVELALSTKLYQIPNIPTYIKNIKLELLHFYQSFSWLVNLNKTLLNIFNNYWFK